MRHAHPGDSLPTFVVNRHRPDRVEPRCKKRRPKEYDLMSKPRAVLREQIRKKHTEKSAKTSKKVRLS